MAKSRLVYFVTQDELDIMTEWLVNKERKEDIGSYILGFLKDSAINGKGNRKAFIKNNTLTQDELDREDEIDSDEKYQKRGGGYQKKILVLSGNAIFNGLCEMAQLQNALNRKTKEKEDKIFHSVEAFCTSMIGEHIETLEVENFKFDVEAEAKKTKKQWEKESKPKEKEKKPKKSKDEKDDDNDE